MLPADVIDLAHLHQLRQQRLALAATNAVADAWKRLSATDVQGSWDRGVGSLIVTLVAQAQLEAARGSQDYVSRTVHLEGGAPDPVGQVPSSAFSGVASDGRPLESLLSYPLFQVQAFTRGGMDVADALGIGLRHLGRMVATQVQDSARISTGVAIVNDRRVAGYIRVVSGSACSRCTILAGRWYAYNAGFARHPHCSCTSAPSTKDVEPQSPKSLFDAMSPEQRRKAGWSEADIKAINDGGDLYQVTNAKRDLRSVSIAGRELQTTLHGSTRRGLAGKRLGAPKGKTAARLTPESIYAEAQRLDWSRDETLAQLRRFGYII